MMAKRKPAPEPAESSHSEAARRKEQALARLRELELAVKSGQLLRVADIKPVWSRRMLMIRNRVLSIPSIAKLRLQLDDLQTHELMEIIREVLTAASLDQMPVAEAADEDETTH